MSKATAIVKKMLVVLVTAVVLMVLAVLFWPNTYNINNGSMRPDIAIGAKVFTSSQSSYDKGDVIAFRATETEGMAPLVVTHRLIGFNADGTLITKGDFNDSKDAPAVPVTKDDVIGKVWMDIPYVGSVQMFMQSHPFLMGGSLLGVIALIIFIPSSKPKNAEKQENEEEKELAPATTTPV